MSELEVRRQDRHDAPGEAGDVYIINSVDDDGNPTGGVAHGVGFAICWQDGPRGDGGDGELAPATGAFVEDILIAAALRLEWFQNSKFACEENGVALAHVREALRCLDARRERRADEGTEGAHIAGPTETAYSEMLREQAGGTPG